MSPTKRNWFEYLSSRWWFYLVLLFLYFLPSFTQKPLDPRNTPQMIIEVLSKPLIYSFPPIFPLFKLLPLVLIAGLFIKGGSFSRLFCGYAAFTYFLFALFQNAAQTNTYGFAVITGNVVLFSLLGAVWVWETIASRPIQSPLRPPTWKLWVLLPAFFAFWFPVNTQSAVPSPDFSLLGLLANEAGLTFCMMTPVYLAMVTLLPAVNPTVLRLTAFVGFITGLMNVAEFFLNASYGWWLGIVHIPLVVISLYALVLSFIRK